MKNKICVLTHFVTSNSCLLILACAVLLTASENFTFALVPCFLFYYLVIENMVKSNQKHSCKTITAKD